MAPPIQFISKAAPPLMPPPSSVLSSSRPFPPLPNGIILVNDPVGNCYCVQGIMSKVLIVDDSDPTIVYSGDWTIGATVANNTYEYRNSFHKSSGATQLDELSYTFNGTGISVYGTLDTPSSNGLPNVVFGIDGQTPTALNATGDVPISNPNIANSHTLLYRSPVLANGQHTLSVKTSTPTNPAAHLYVDFFTVSTGSDDAAGDIIVDDRDISIAYTGNWIPNGGDNEYNRTTRQCPDTPNGGTATFKFNGTAITIYGTTPRTIGNNTSTAHIGFDIDGTRIGTFTGPQNAPVVFHTPFFHVEGLPNDKEHTIVMNTLSSTVWYLDYMVYTTENSAGVVDVEQGSSGAETKLGPIIGCAVSGVVLLALLIAGITFAVLRWRRVKLKREAKEAAVSEEQLFAPIVPFTNPSPSADQSTFDLPDTPYVSPGPSGIMMASKYNRASASARANTSTMRVLNPVPESVYTGIGTSTYSSIPETNHSSTSGSAGQERESLPPQSQRFENYSHRDSMNRGSRKGEAGKGRSTYQSRALGGISGNQDRTKVQPNNEKARFTHPPEASTATQATTQPSLPLVVVVPPSVEEDSGIRIPVMSPPLYTPL